MGQASANGSGIAGFEMEARFAKENQMDKIGPTNREVTMATVIHIEKRVKARICLAEIAREVKLPYSRVERICLDMHMAYRP